MKKLYLIFLIVFISGCWSTTKPPPPISVSYKAAFDWQPGTYWIYRDSISGQVDSYAVADNVPADYSNSNSRYITSVTGYINVYQGGEPYPCFFIFYIDATGMSIGGRQVPCGDYAPVQPIQLFLTPQQGAYTNYTLDSLGGLILAGDTFYNVQQGTMQTYDPVSNSYFSTNQYFATAAVGILKMRRFDSSLYIPNRVWELQRWKIVK